MRSRNQDQVKTSNDLRFGVDIIIDEVRNKNMFVLEINELCNL